MSIKYKINILAELKKAGYSSYRLRKEKILTEGTISKIRRKEIINSANLSIICELLNCQPGDVLEYVPDQDSNQEDSTQSDSQ